MTSPAQVYKMFNPKPFELSPNDPSITLNLSQLNATHNPFIATRQPHSQDLGSMSIEDFISNQRFFPEMVFTDQISLGLWIKIPNNDAFDEKAFFMEIYFSEVVEGTEINLYNESLVTQEKLNTESFSKIDLCFPHNQWVFLVIEYYLSSDDSQFAVKKNDVDVIRIKDTSIIFQPGSLENVLLSIGTNDFTFPLVKK